MGGGRPPGPQGRRSALPDLKDGTLCLQPSPPPGPVRYSLWPELHQPGFLPAAFGMCVTDTDKEEFKIIRKMPVYDNRRRPYRTVNNYVAHRTMFFGSPSTYATFAAESDAELANTKWVGKKRTRTLQSMVEFSKKGEARKQQIFYRWVRKAYQKKYGVDVNVPELIRKGMSQELADKIAEVRGSVRVKEANEEQFKAGGFNPRPVKYRRRYLLGTLSEHATGMAVDIDSRQNAQLTIEEWHFIETLAGKQVTLRGRWTTEASVTALWTDIEEVNDLFVANVAAGVQRIEKERAAKEKAEKEKAEKEKAAKALTETDKKEKAQAASARKEPPKPPLKPPLEELLGKHFKALSRWSTDGFFNLALELVVELHAHGFVWGASFGTNVDLHHFEIPE